jgi:dTDP-L-rhamnose 4-epimerase
VSARVLVTGGAGFIGSHIVDALIDSGREVVVLDSLLPSVHESVPSYLNDKAIYVWADLREPGTLDGLLEDVEAVVHQAGVVGLERSFAEVVTYVSNNDVGTAQLLRALHAANWRGPLILASSMVVYGEGSYSCEQHGFVRPNPRTADRLKAGQFEACCPRCGRDLIPSAVQRSVELMMCR